MNIYEVLSYTVPSNPMTGEEQQIVRTVTVGFGIGYAEVEQDFAKKYPNERVSGFNTLANAIQ